jgi:hypothetical protein
MYTFQVPIIGLPPISYATGPDNTQKAALGLVVPASDPYWGGAEFLYMQAAAAIPLGSVAVGNAASGTTSALKTGYSGRALAVAPFDFAANQYGWFQVSGQVPIRCTTALAAGNSFGLTGTGTVGINSAGVQVLSATVVAPSTTAVIKTNVITKAGSTRLVVPNLDGWFPGIALTGAGIGGGAVINAINADGSVTASLPSTADGSVTVTGTYSGYIIGQINRPFLQGAIT